MSDQLSFDLDFKFDNSIKAPIVELIQDIDYEDNRLQKEIDAFPPRYERKHSDMIIKELVNTFSKINYRFDDFLDLVLSALESREEDYLSVVNRIPRNQLDDYVNYFNLISKFFFDGYYDDILGEVYCQICAKSSMQSVGYFPTPFHLCLMMAKITDPKPNESMHEPSIGSGAIVLATKYHIHDKYGWSKSCSWLNNVTGCDIGLTQVKMAKTQLYLSNYWHMINITHKAMVQMNSKEAM